MKTLIAAKIWVGILLIGRLLVAHPGGADAVIQPRGLSLDGVMRPAGVYVKTGRLYVTERVRLHVFSLKSGKRIASFGREGAGPGEVRNRIFAVYFRNGEVVVPSVGKITFLTPGGDFIRELSMPVPRSGDICPLEKNFAGLRFHVEGKSFFLELALFDGNGQVIRRLARIRDDFQPGKGMRAFIPPTSFTVHRDRVFATFTNDFRVDVFTPAGQREFSIERKYTRLRVTEKHRKAVLDHFRTAPEYKRYFERIRKEISFPQLLPAIRHLIHSGDRLYIRTFLRREGRTEFFIYTTDGSFIRRAMVPLDEPEGFVYRPPILFTFDGDTLYQLIESEETGWHLEITPGCAGLQ